MNFRAAVVCLLSAPLLLSSQIDARQPRSAAAKHEFQREHPCPSTGQRRGKCPGYIIDHIEPLCADGKDAAINMQWQTIADAKAKDRDEIRQCRIMRRQ